MDKIIKITLGLFIVLLVAFAASAGYSAYVENSYRTSLSSSYSYTCTITTDSPLTNVTLFIPVPADPAGNSPIIGEFSAHTISGVPDTWKTELYDTGKATLVKITAPSLAPGTITLYTNVTSKNFIGTQDPVENSPMFRPVQDLKTTECATGVAGGQCTTYRTALYADYRAAPGTSVTIASSLVGRNEWKVLEPEFNEYRTGITALMSGDQKDWTTVSGYLQSGIGAHDAPSQRG
jgi:hypothetical protein